MLHHISVMSRHRRGAPRDKALDGDWRKRYFVRMRYVIAFVAIAFFLIWDGIYNRGQYLDFGVREIRAAVQYVTA